VTQSGSNVSGVTVNWSTPNGGSVSQTSGATGSDGLACTRMTLGTAAGSQAAQAAVSGATGSPLSFNATANPGNASSLVKSGGDNQSGNVGSVLGEPLGARVTDAFGNGVSGALVTWLLSSGSATFAPTSGNSNASGIVTTVVTLGPTPGPIVITASAAGLVGSPQTYNLSSNTPGAHPTAITILVQNNLFSPATDTVAAGGTVTWSWSAGSGPHSVTSTGTDVFTSDPRGGTVTGPTTYGPITFSTPGTYYYYCTVHGFPGSTPSGMSGVIVVE
jgi:plastocyanin